MTFYREHLTILEFQEYHAYSVPSVDDYRSQNGTKRHKHNLLSDYRGSKQFMIVSRIKSRWKIRLQDL